MINKVYQLNLVGYSDPKGEKFDESKNVWVVVEKENTEEFLELMKNHSVNCPTFEVIGTEIDFGISNGADFTYPKDERILIERLKNTSINWE